MTRILQTAALVAFVAFCLVISTGGPSTAHAGESTYIGSIVVRDAGSVNNRQTENAFKIGGAGTCFTVQTFDAGAWFLSSQGGVADKQGLWIPAGAAIPSTIDWNALDAGSSYGYTSGLVSCRPEQGQVFTQCIFLKSTRCK